MSVILDFIFRKSWTVWKQYNGKVPEEALKKLACISCGAGVGRANDPCACALRTYRPGVLKFTIAEPQPTPCIQTFIPGLPGRSTSDTMIFAVKDSSFPSP